MTLQQVNSPHPFPLFNQGQSGGDRAPPTEGTIAVLHLVRTQLLFIVIVQDNGETLVDLLEDINYPEAPSAIYVDVPRFGDKADLTAN